MKEVAEILTAIAGIWWPLGLVVIAVLFRKQIATKLQTLSGFRTHSTELSFDVRPQSPEQISRSGGFCLDDATVRTILEKAGELPEDVPDLKKLDQLSAEEYGSVQLAAHQIVTAAIVQLAGLGKYSRQMNVTARSKALRPYLNPPELFVHAVVEIDEKEVFVQVLYVADANAALLAAQYMLMTAVSLGDLLFDDRAKWGFILGLVSLADDMVALNNIEANLNDLFAPAVQDGRLRIIKLAPDSVLFGKIAVAAANQLRRN